MTEPPRDPDRSPDDAADDPAATEQTPDPRIGMVIDGRYRVVRRVGGGGMGEVYEASHETIQRRSAIKFLHAKYSARSSMLARFRREAKAAGRLEHENITAVIDFGVTDDVPYLVMEYLEGEDLAHLLRRQRAPLPAPRSVSLLLQACRGIELAHRRGTVHRDLKPQNLFVCRRADGSDLVKVLDFGVAKMSDGTQTGDGTATQTGTAVGTPCYMSPEQARGDKRIDERTDVYALGLILYECLTGTRAYRGDSYNAVLYQVLHRRPEPLGELRPELPTRLIRIVDRATAFEPADRYESADELAAALQAALDQMLARGEQPRNAEPELEPGMQTVRQADDGERSGEEASGSAAHATDVATPSG
ncbi:MAG: serine/threonine protein kinase, partial [Deltaproteobacteria bacterium]|nr:serine/threonine protein kinase [Deltaproteobacteria bacterium]MBW2535272.1 serine/threonine protein kinase [Deltaproteobacteria bacterium]